MKETRESVSDCHRRLVTDCRVTYGWHRWELVYRGESHNLRGWRGEEKTVWIQDGNRLLHLTAGR